MYRHDFEPLTFRLSPWPWGGVAYRKFFRSESYNIIMPELVDHLEEQLSKTQFTIHKATFSLVNVYSRFTHRGYGIVVSPQSHLLPPGPVTFTFSNRRRLSPVVPQLTHKLNHYTTMWGYSIRDQNDYVTVSIPLNMAMRARMNNTLFLQMEMLYKVMGGLTKNFVNAHRHFQSSTQMMQTRLLYKTIPQVLHRYPRSNWHYAEEFWQLCPDLLVPEHTKEYLEYFFMYLGEYYRVGGKRLLPFFDYMYDTYHKGIRDLMLERNTEEARLVSRLRPRSLPDTVNIEKLAEDLCRGIV